MLLVMKLPDGDRELVQIVDLALANAARCAGPWLACRPGCTQCCHGAFAINQLDALRLRTGMEALRTENPAIAEAVKKRARAWLTEFGADFPGDPVTGVLGTSDEEQERFEDFANDAPCPALNPMTGLCDVYEWRPMTCRVFGPPVRMNQGDDLGCCELCFVGATDDEIAACEMRVPHELEAGLVAEVSGAAGREESDDSASPRETIVAFALLP